MKISIQVTSAALCDLEDNAHACEGALISRHASLRERKREREIERER